MQDVADDLAGLDHTGPGGQAGHAHAAFGEVTFTAGVEGLRHPARAVVNKGAVVGHDDDQGVFGDALGFKMLVQLADEGVDFDQGLGQDVLVGGKFGFSSRIGKECRCDGVVGCEKWLLGCHALVDKSQSAFLGLSFDIPVIFDVRRWPPLQGLAALGTLERPDRAAGLPGVIDVVFVLTIQFGKETGDHIANFGLRHPHAGNLVVRGEEGLVIALVVDIAELGVAEVAETKEVH